MSTENYSQTDTLKYCNRRQQRETFLNDVLVAMSNGRRKPAAVAKALGCHVSHAHRVMKNFGCRPVWLTPNEQKRVKEFYA